MEFDLITFEANIADAVRILRENGVAPINFAMTQSMYNALKTSIETREKINLPVDAQIYVESVPCIVSGVTQH